jgi:hypothetical protein
MAGAPPGRLSEVDFLPKEKQSRHSRESGNPGKRRKMRPRTLDARLRGHDNPEKPNRRETRENRE